MLNIVVIPIKALINMINIVFLRGFFIINLLVILALHRILAGVAGAVVSFIPTVIVNAERIDKGAWLFLLVCLFVISLTEEVDYYRGKKERPIYKIRIGFE